MAEAAKESRVKVLRQFFEADDGKKMSLQEFKALSSEEREELYRLIKAEKRK